MSSFASIMFRDVEIRLIVLFGIIYFVVVVLMVWWSERELVVVVSNGGGFGTFGAVGWGMGLIECYVRETIVAIRERTDWLFGVGFITQLIVY